MRYVSLMIVAVVLAATALAGQGLAITIANSGFEAPWTPTDINPDGVAYGGVAGNYSAHGAPGWNEIELGAGNGAIVNPGATYGFQTLSMPAGHGDWHAALNADAQLQQTVGTLQPGTYVLSVDAGHFGPKPPEVEGTPPNQYANEIARLIAGTTALTAVSSVIPADPGAHNWATKQWTFAIAADNPLVNSALKVNLSVVGGGGQGDFDNVALNYSTTRPITIVNADFEAPWTSASLNPAGVAVGGETGSYSLHGAIGWTEAGSASAGIGVGASANVSLPAGHGSQYVFVNGAGPETLTQVLGDTVKAGTYTLSVDAMHFGTDPGTGAPNQYANEVAQLWAGNTMLTPISELIPTDPGPTNWARKSWTYTIAADDVSKHLSIVLTVLNNGGQGDFDNVALSFTPVPEPSTLVLAGMGLLGLLAYAWRKRK